MLILLCFLSMFPAYAGVIPSRPVSQVDMHDVPRVCGGDPAWGKLQVAFEECSPRMRG